MSTELVNLHESAVIVDPLPGIQAVCATVWIHRGSRDEHMGARGAAHLVEHLVTAGGEADGSGFMQMVDAMGGQPKVLTTPEFTVYGFTAPAESWQSPWRALTGQLATASAGEPLLADQRRVVVNEIADAADNLDRLVHQRAIEDLLGADPLARPAMGTADGVRKLTPEGVESHIAEAHTRENLTIVLSGAVAPDLATEEAERLVRALPAGGTGDAYERTLPTATPGRTRHVRHQSRAHVLVSWLVPLESAIDAAALGVLNRAMGGGFRGRVKERFAGTDASYSLYSYRSTFSDCAVWTVLTICDQADTEEVADQIVAAQRELFTTRPLDRREVGEAARALAGSLALGLETTHMRANWLGRTFLATRELPTYESARRNLQGLTDRDVIALCRRMGGPAITIIGSGSSE